MTADLYEMQFEGLCHVHGLLAAQLTTIVDTPDEAELATLLERAKAAGHFLLGHHHMEDTILFPGLREEGRGAQAFLDERDREHHLLHGLTERLLAQTAAPGPSAPEVRTLARELRHVFAEHVQREEAGLAPEQLRRIIAPNAFAGLVARIDAARAAAQVAFPRP